MNIIFGLGNLLFSDEGIGIHIIRELEKRDNIKNTIYADLGTSSMEIDYFLTPELKKMVVIDCLVGKDMKPGSIYALEKTGLLKNSTENKYSLHQLKFIDTIKILSLSQNLPELLILGVSPFDADTMSSDLSKEMKLNFLKIIKKIEKKIINYFTST